MHIGVLRYLEEEELIPRHISWTSMGAIVAAAYALGMSRETIANHARNVKLLSLIDLNLRKWLLQWDKIVSFLTDIFGDRTFHDTLIPLTIVATQLDTWKEVVFDSWRIIDALRASMSVPSIFSPCELNWVQYVDGWLVNNLPISVLDDTNVLAISTLFHNAHAIDKKRTLFWIPLPYTVFDYSRKILQQSLLIMMEHNEQLSVQYSEKNIQFLIPLTDSSLSVVDFDKVDEFISEWYAYAQQHIDMKSLK